MFIAKKFLNKNVIIQFIKFGIIGFSNTIIGLGIYYFLLWLGVNYLICNIIGWLISVLNAFYWNNRYVFKNKNCWIRSIFKTYLSYGFSFLVGIFLLVIFVEFLSITKTIAPILTLFVTVPLNFLLNKFWAFK